MDVQNYTEIIDAGKRAHIEVSEHFQLDFYSITLVPSKDDSNEVRVYIKLPEQEEKVMLCLLSERLGIYQQPIQLSIEASMPVDIEVIGKGTVMLVGATYDVNVFEGCSCDEEGCCCGDMDEDLIDDEEVSGMDEE